MAKSRPLIVPENLQPSSGDYTFDLDRAFASIVGLKALIPKDAFTVKSLGAERRGHGAIISDDGLILTIGYLIVEAETIWLQTVDGRVVQGHALAYDPESGFGLVKALASLDLPHLTIGSAKLLSPGDPLIVAGGGGRDYALQAQLVATQEFAGYWEYLLSDALFTAPAHPFWGGAGVLDERGLLIGLASLQIEQTPHRGEGDLNMVAPVDIVKPVLTELMRFGRRDKPPRPWLGLYAAEMGERIVIVGVAEGGPADEAGLQTGDILIAINDERPKTLAALWRRIWSMGSAGVEAPLLIEREGKIVSVRVKSADRLHFTRTPILH